jgi:UDP-2,4-diacetamido-2,4,6-trideoxy-beta-L-altropyranose hydrolase
MTSTDKGDALRLRLAEIKDRELVWNWANEPAVRQASFQSDPISWDAHKEWFDARLQNVSCHFYIATDLHGSPVGQVRFEVENKVVPEATIDISLDRSCRGTGLGVAVLKLGCRTYRRGTKLPLVGYVKEENLSSMKMFESAGFVHDGFVSKNNCRAVRWVLSLH